MSNHHRKKQDLEKHHHKPSHSSKEHCPKDECKYDVPVVISGGHCSKTIKIDVQGHCKDFKEYACGKETRQKVKNIVIDIEPEVKRPVAKIHIQPSTCHIKPKGIVEVGPSKVIIDQQKIYVNLRHPKGCNTPIIEVEGSCKPEIKIDKPEIKVHVHKPEVDYKCPILCIVHHDPCGKKRVVEYDLEKQRRK